MYKKVDSKLLQIGNNVREYRKQKHYNQEKLAELLDVSVATVSRIENKTVFVQFSPIKAFYKSLNEKVNSTF